MTLSGSISISSIRSCLSLLAFFLFITAVNTEKQCRCYPGDTCWPSPTAWASFNQSLGGKLIATIPFAAPCHNDVFAAYNSTECNSLRDIWLLPQTHYETSSSVMAPFFANRSCDPFLPKHARCVIGTYVKYAVNASNSDDIKKTIAFATEENIRLVIRNTGHDYNGKSTGAGALGIWTHHLKNVEIIDYESSHYCGKAIKMGAGVQGFEAYAVADANHLAVVGGECPTVGLAGGYTQGGGHSALASKYGLAADQALEWEVVDGTGQVLQANQTHHSDLYWALSGGGGGTYGVVVSLTSKAHVDIPVSGANLTFTNEGVSQDDYYAAISAYHASLPAMVDAGVTSVWYFTNVSFSISPLTGPGVHASQLEDFLKPLRDTLQSLNMSYTQVVRQFPNYLEEFTAMQGPIKVGIAQYGGRLIPRSVVQDNNHALTAAYRYITENGGQFIGVALDVSGRVAGQVSNAVLPAWRETLIDTVITTPWNFTAPLCDMIASQEKMTEDFIPLLEALTPNSGCYLNEGNFLQPDWQNVFYGSNYNRLLSIKNRYDPDHVFYAATAVGSDYWTVEPDGRLCKS